MTGDKLRGRDLHHFMIRIAKKMVVYSAIFFLIIQVVASICFQYAKQYVYREEKKVIYEMGQELQEISAKQILS